MLPGSCPPQTAILTPNSFPVIFLPPSSLVLFSHSLTLQGIDQIADTSSTLPHMLPSTSKFSELIGELGIERSDHVVVYDSWPMIATAPRAYYTFRVFGHENVLVLSLAHSYIS